MEGNLGKRKVNLEKNVDRNFKKIDRKIARRKEETGPDSVWHLDNGKGREGCDSMLT